MKLTVDDRAFLRAIKNITPGEKDMRTIEYAGSRPIVNSQRERVPTDTAATKLSIDSHVTEASKVRVVDEIGPETNYAVYLEYGIGEHAESGQGRKGGWWYKDERGWHFTYGMRARPYVRPSVAGQTPKQVYGAITSAFANFLRAQWKT